MNELEFVIVCLLIGLDLACVWSGFESTRLIRAWEQSSGCSRAVPIVATTGNDFSEQHEAYESRGE